MNFFIFFLTFLQVYYSLFAIDTRESKAELSKILNELISLLMRTMENLIIDSYHNSIEKYNNLHKMIDKKICTPDELVEMETTKSEIQTELINLGKEFDDTNRIYIFLIYADNIFSENIITKTEEMKRRFDKFKRDYEE